MPSHKRSKVKIPVTKGKLSKYGYGIHKSQQQRRKSLKRASKEYGPLSVSKKLNVLVIYNKNKHPSLSKKFKKDRDWLSKTMIKRSRSSRKTSRSSSILIGGSSCGCG